MNNKKGVYSLNYNRKNLNTIPKEILKYKDSLIQLDVSGNNFTDFNSVIQDLKKFTKLKILKINIYTQQQAKNIIDSMPNLEYLNDEPINEEIESTQENINEYIEKDNEEEEVIINIPLIKLCDKTFEPVFKKFKEFYDINKEKEENFQKIIEDFNNFGKKLKIAENNDKNLENFNIKEVEKKMELYKLLFNKLNQIKDDIITNKNQYKENSINYLINIMQENEKIKEKINQVLLLKKQNGLLTGHINNNYTTSENKNIKNNNINIDEKLISFVSSQNNENIFQEKNKSKKTGNKNINNNKNNKNKKHDKNIKRISKFPSSSMEQNTNNNIFLSNLVQQNNKSKVSVWKNRSFNKYSDRERSPVTSSRKIQNRSTYSEYNRNTKRSIFSNNKIKKYSKQVNLIENYNDPNITCLLMKNKSTIDTINIFDDGYNDQIYKDKLNIRNINLNNLLEIINQIYKIRHSRIEKQKQGVYNKSTLEQDLYTYLKSKYGLKKLIVEWNLNILSSIQTYIKLNGEVYLFALILRNELDEDSIEILNIIKKTVNNILNLLYDYEIKYIESIKQNKEFIKEFEWKTISKCLYSDDEFLRNKFVNKINKFIDKMVKGQNLTEKTGKKILFSDYMNILIIFNLKLRKKYLHNLFLLFSQQDKNRTGIINLEGFKNIIKNCGIFNDEKKREEVTNDLIEIADEEGSGQITFNDTVQCLDNMDLILNDGKVKFLDKLSSLNFEE